MFKNFKLKKSIINGIKINYRIGGKGPYALLLLHGYPQTHIMWRKIADKLAKHYTVVCSDLRGYGDSDKPPQIKSFTIFKRKNGIRPT